VGVEENKKLIEQIPDDVAKGDGSLFRACLADDVVMRITGEYSWPQTFEGKQELLTNSSSIL
jgi:ketosteroid isomerase-like protein